MNASNIDINQARGEPVLIALFYIEANSNLGYGHYECKIFGSALSSGPVLIFIRF
jgi:hypothetical protein